MAQIVQEMGLRVFTDLVGTNRTLNGCDNVSNIDHHRKNNVSKIGVKTHCQEVN